MKNNGEFDKNNIKMEELVFVSSKCLCLGRR